MIESILTLNHYHLTRIRVTVDAADLIRFDSKGNLNAVYTDDKIKVSGKNPVKYEMEIDLFDLVGFLSNYFSQMEKTPQKKWHTCLRSRYKSGKERMPNP